MPKLSDSENREMLSRLFQIALPIMAQNLLSSSLSFVDTLMIGQLGQEQIAAVGIANQVYFLISLFFFGIASGSSIFLSQFFGAGDWRRMRNTMSVATLACFLGSVVMALFSYLFPDWILGFFSSDPPVVASGRAYMKIVAPSYLFSAVSATLSIGFRAVGKAGVPMRITLVSLVQNALGNWLLIFGIGPFPELGVAGAAISTALARLVEMCLLVFLTWRKGGQVFAFRPSDLRCGGAFLKSLAATSLPVLANEVLWSFGMTLYKVSYSSLGTTALATVNITESIANFFFIAMLGIGNGTTILMGNVLGAGEREKAIRLSGLLVKLSVAVGVVMGVLEFVLAPVFSSWFNVSAAVLAAATLCLRVQAFMQPLKSVNMTVIVGILRAGGDTRYALFAEMFGVYAVGVPVSFISASVLGLDLHIVYLLLGLEEAVKFVLGTVRVRSGKWANVLSDR